MLTPTDILHEPPFGAVVHHMEVVVSTVERLRPLFTALSEGNEAQLASIGQEIADLEEAADQIKNAVRDELPKDIKLPVSRRDLLEVVSTQDTVSDNCLRVVWLLETRDFVLHDQIAPSLFSLIDTVTDTTKVSLRLVEQIQILSEGGFRGGHLNEAYAIVREIEGREADSDKKARDALKALFSLEHELGAVSTLLWYRIIDLIGSLADGAKRHANRVRLMLAK